MKYVWAASALTEVGWQRDVLIGIDDVGVIVSVEPGRSRKGYTTDILLPAPVNAHSHAFQRAMAGLTERRGPDPADTFWTWREQMFRFLDCLTPEDIGAIAAMVQMEMLEAGYAASVEFHYLHHQADGTPYDNLAEMSARIVAAAETTGIGLTLLPVFYQYGGCDQRPLGAGQIRFGNDLERFAVLHSAAGSALRALPSDARLGVAPHSLRAVGCQNLDPVTALAGNGPVHIHLAEQIAEVDEVQSATSKRPVEWLLANANPDDRWCLIHCTQMLPHETAALAETGAVAGLCPITEANLGDGVFDGKRWLNAGGRIAVGSDSNIRISLAGELRMLEYSQRLKVRERSVLADSGQSNGRRLFDDVLAGGARSADRNSGRIAPGCLADLLALDGNDIDLALHEEDRLLDCFIFVAGTRAVRQVWSAGRHVVIDGRHIRREAIASGWHRTMSRLKDTL